MPTVGAGVGMLQRRICNLDGGEYEERSWKFTKSERGRDEELQDYERYVGDERLQSR
jgi:hypothetical protein